MTNGADKKRIALDGDEELIAALQAFGDRAQDAVRNVNIATGLELRTEIIKGYQRGGKTGRVYEKYNPRRTHQASAPGEPPASDLSGLANSVTFDEVEGGGVEVFTLVEYGSWLEFGTEVGGEERIAARPLWVPETETMRPKYNKRLRDVLVKLTRET